MLMTYFPVRRIESFTISTVRTGAQLKPAQARRRRVTKATKVIKARVARVAAVLDQAVADKAAASTSTILISAASARRGVAARNPAALTSSKRCLAAALAEAAARHAAVAAGISKRSSKRHSKKRIAVDAVRYRCRQPRRVRPVAVQE